MSDISDIEEMLQAEIDSERAQLQRLDTERRRLLRELTATEAYVHSIKAAYDRYPEFRSSNRLPPGLEEALLAWLAETGTNELRLLLGDSARRARAVQLLKGNASMTCAELLELLWEDFPS